MLRAFYFFLSSKSTLKKRVCYQMVISQLIIADSRTAISGFTWFMVNTVVLNASYEINQH